MTRQITINLSDKFARLHDRSSQYVIEALQYAFFWAYESGGYPRVTIYGTSEGELHCTYTNKEDERHFFMCGVFYNDKFNFHS